jgi:hypothetical protein
MTMQTPPYRDSNPVWRFADWLNRIWSRIRALLFFAAGVIVVLIIIRGSIGDIGLLLLAVAAVLVFLGSLLWYRDSQTKKATDTAWSQGPSGSAPAPQTGAAPRRQMPAPPRERVAPAETAATRSAQIISAYEEVAHIEIRRLDLPISGV